VHEPPLHSFPTRRSSDLLRGAFVRDRAGGWRQLVVATAPIDITERDLRGQDADLTDLLTAELVRPFDFAAPPLMRFLLLRVGDRSEEHTSELQSRENLVS